MNVASRGHRLGAEATPESAASLRLSMAAGEVLDTAALIAWPLERMRGSLVVHSQRAELSRISPDREIILDAAGLEWASPSSSAITRASDLATATGDMAGLSPVDLELLALTIERTATLATDDYRLQNLCELGGGVLALCDHGRNKLTLVLGIALYGMRGGFSLSRHT